MGSVLASNIDLNSKSIDYLGFFNDELIEKIVVETNVFANNNNKFNKLKITNKDQMNNLNNRMKNWKGMTLADLNSCLELTTTPPPPPPEICFTIILEP